MKTTGELMDVLKNQEHPDFSTLDTLTFCEYLEALRQSRSVTRAEILQKTSLDRTYGYQIFSGLRKPSKKKVVQLALAMELSLEQTNRLLSLAGCGSLYAKIPEDAVIIHSLLHHISCARCSLELESRGFEPLE